MDGYTLIAAVVGGTMIASIIGIRDVERIQGSRPTSGQRSLFKNNGHQI